MSMGPVVHEVVRRAVDPAGVPISEEAADATVQGEHPHRSQPDSAKTLAAVR